MMTLFRHTLTPLLLALCTLTVAGSGYAESRDPEQHFFHQSFNNLVEEVAIVRQQNLTGLVVMFSDEDCPWCQKMKATVMSQPSVQDYYREHFRVLHIDTRGDTPITDFNGEEMSEKDFAFKIHRVRATPVFIFFDQQGNPVQRYTGATRDVAEFLWLAEFVVSGDYQRTSFTKYKRQRRERAALGGLSG